MKQLLITTMIGMLSFSSMTFGSIRDMLLKDNDLQGWVADFQDTGYANTENKLFELVDGGAENYIACNFKECIKWSYTGLGAQIILELYDQSTKSDAIQVFKKWNPEIDNTYEKLSYSDLGYIKTGVTGYSINMAFNNYYANISLESLGEDKKKALIEFGKKLATKSALIPILKTGGMNAHHLTYSYTNQTYTFTFTSIEKTNDTPLLSIYNQKGIQVAQLRLTRASQTAFVGTWSGGNHHRSISSGTYTIIVTHAGRSLKSQFTFFQ